jgi:hypothetical protein
LECNEVSRAINDRVGEVGVAKPVVQHGHALTMGEFEVLRFAG